MVAAAGAVHPHASAQSDHQSPPHPTPPHLISHLSPSIFIYKAQNYNLQIYKATNTNRCNINGVCLVVLAKEDINYPMHACGSVSIGLMCMKEKNTH